MAINFKLKLEDVKKAKDETTKILNNLKQDPELQTTIGQLVVDDIKLQTRKGFSIVRNAKFKPLTNEWVEKRKQIKATPGQRISEVYSPKRSNLSLSGQLIDSVRFSIGKVIRIFADGERTPYQYTIEKKVNGKKTKITKTIESSVDNAELSEYVSEQGRPFIGFRDKVRRNILIKIRQFFSKRLGKI
jgi:hypothetical protein